MIALVDCNNFFVSCERIFDLSLRGKPVGILSNNDGCIISRSNELKKLGVAMCAPAFQLRDIQKKHNIILRSSNFSLYGDISNRVMSILSMHTHELEPYSIDEAFLQLPHGKTAIEYHAWAEQVKAQILKWTSIPVGIGIASTKTLAKLANEIAKSSGKGVFIMPKDTRDLFENTPISDVWGIGRRTAETLNKNGIQTIAHLLAMDHGYIQRNYNLPLIRTIEELKGNPVLELLSEEESPQSVAVSRSFGTPVTTLKELEESVAYYMGLLAEKLRKEKLSAQGCTLYAQYYPEYGENLAQGGSTSTQVVFTSPLCTTADMLRAVKPHISQLYIAGRRFKKTGVISFGLQSNQTQQADLFSDNGHIKNEKLYQIMDQLNQQMGKGTVFHLSEGIQKNWQMKRNNLSPAYTTAWNDILRVKS